MPIKVKLKAHLNDEQLKQRWDTASTIEYGKRWQLLWLVQTKKYSLSEASKVVGHTLTWGRYWFHLYNAEGPTCIEAVRTRNPNPPFRKLDIEKRNQIYNAVIEPVPEAIGGGQWSGPKVVRYVRHTWNINIHRDTGWVLLKEANLSLQTARPVHSKSSENVKNNYKKNFSRNSSTRKVSSRR